MHRDDRLDVTGLVGRKKRSLEHCTFLDRQNSTSRLQLLDYAGLCRNNPVMASTTATLAGRYRLDAVIGRGGMSTVYRATDQLLGRLVAVKVLAAVLAEDDAVSTARFEREARAAAAVAHPGIATVYDAGAEDGSRFIVMELVPGRSLAQILRDQGPLIPSRAVAIAAQVADVLSAAHGAGIIHRDIKPANVMIGERDRIKVLDFGIARATDATALTQTASVLGTAAYMSPEQAVGQQADERSDIYALGCMLYAMLTGTPPFGGELQAAILHQQVNAEPLPLGECAGQVSPALDALVAQMLAKDPGDRPTSAAEVRDRLDAVASRPRAADDGAAGAISSTASTRVLGVDPGSIPTTVLGSATTRVLPRRRIGAGGGHRLIAFAVVAALLGGAMALAFSAASSHHGAIRSTSNAGAVPPSRATSTPATATTRAPAPAPPPAAKRPAHGPPAKHKEHRGHGDGGKHRGD